MVSFLAIDDVLKLYLLSMRRYGGARHTGEFRTNYTEIIGRRENIIDEVHRLNHKGLKRR